MQITLFQPSPTLTKTQTSAPYFEGGRKLNITKEQMESLVNQGLCVKEIREKLGNISQITYQRLLNKFNIQTPRRRACAKNSQVTKGQIEALLQQGFSQKVICEKLGNITRTVYFNLLNKFGIQTPLKLTDKKLAQISKEQFAELVKSGKTRKEICEELDISVANYQLFLTKFGIDTSLIEQKKRIANLTKEDLLALINNGKTRKENCQELNISLGTFNLLLKKFGIQTKQMQYLQNATSITKEQLQELVDTGLAWKEIEKQLNISRPTFYKLLKFHNIKYDYKHHSKEIVIPRETLKKMADSKKSLDEISEELGITKNTYSVKARIAKINTAYRESIDKLASISKDEFRKSLDAGLSVDEICRQFNISAANYAEYVAKNNLSTKQKKALSKVSQISREQLLAMKKSGKTIKEICDELDIEYHTYRRILK